MYVPLLLLLAAESEGHSVTHHIILAHVSAVQAYRESFKPKHSGVIGITLNGDWALPYDDSLENITAAQHALDVVIGWFADPIYLGHYPNFMHKMLREWLPVFTLDELMLIKGSSDFYGMNTYTTNLCKAGSDDEFQGLVEYTFTRPNGTQLGMQGTQSSPVAHCPTSCMISP
ncbi:glycoside hydrolase superfamily [Vararia minispora EC-137]|uniref:Glycoside hydrolase superfamily n=1 Tax=Vararia minispora EC-137 TaxID=1314806 RepID=A0ACB8Q5I7_9AGAM|nr:glycoside hydrolase superfamily [Vararia minispora EC-137]